MCDAAKTGDWHGVEAGFRELTDPVLHQIAIGLAGRLLDRAVAEEAAAADPTSALAGTLWAWRLVEDGWEIRTGAWGNEVSAEQWKGFRAHLRRAEQILIQVTARHPDYTSAWTERLHTARGLGLGQAEARRRYEKAMRAVPHFFPAQQVMIQQLCPKWGGSYDAMHSFADECAEASPPGSVNGAVVALAHIEHLLLVIRDESAGAGVAYLKRVNVQEDLRWAAEHSVLNPAFQPAPGWVAAHSAFAMAFSMGDNQPAAAKHYEALLAGGNLADETPWKYFDDQVAEFVSLRDHAFKKGARP
ncbi:hypothetical protein SAMN05421812_101466 [Asanoa hainanensis]|uniref:DUF4034 domain-containing protein n=1 Tax=Asanoa hainanensis TaxID=560556 RepID=A0A239GMA7_9ACTN|nr:hypothetical protein SAMN05421812_101466 [Asanoa hainanensis]